MTEQQKNRINREIRVAWDSCKRYESELEHDRENAFKIGSEREFRGRLSGILMMLEILGVEYEDNADGVPQIA